MSSLSLHLRSESLSLSTVEHAEMGRNYPQNENNAFPALSKRMAKVDMVLQYITVTSKSSTEQLKKSQ